MTTAATVVNVHYAPRGAALELFNSDEPEICMSGAAGTGKSVAALMYLHLSCLAKPKVRALIVRKTHASLTASTLVTFREKVAKEAIEAGVLRFYGGSAQEPASYKYRNGSIIVMGGLDRASRLLSTEFDVAFVDEAIESTAEDLDTIVSRLRNGVLSRQRLIMATNPGAPTHHLKQRADAGRCRILYSRHEDNPRLYDNDEWTEYGQTYMNRLKSLTGVRRARLYEGKWAAAEGVIYDEFDPPMHVIDRFDIPDTWTRWWACDFGFVHPFVAQWWAEDPEGRLYLYREHVMTGRLVEDHAKTMLRAVQNSKGQWIEPRPRAIICDHDAEGRATLERHLGMSTVAAQKTVLDGIEACAGRLRPAAHDGRPRVYLLRDSLLERDQALVDAAAPTCLAEEIPGYVWDTGAGKRLKEAPLKEQDDCCDTWRYVVAERDLGARPRIRVMGGGRRR